jgi:hypothetical protein
VGLRTRDRFRSHARRRPAADQLGLGPRQQVAIELALGRRRLDPRMVALVGDPDPRLARSPAIPNGAEDDDLVALECVQRDGAEDQQREDPDGEKEAHRLCAIHRATASARVPALPRLRELGGEGDRDRAGTRGPVPKGLATNQPPPLSHSPLFVDIAAGG